MLWNEGGELLCITTDESFFILKYSSEAVDKARNSQEGVTEDGIEDAFEVGIKRHSKGFYVEIFEGCK